jgi:actin
MYDGIQQRMEKEMRALARGDWPRVRVISTSHRQRSNGVWIGGSILVSLSSFQPQWITQLEYDETGPQIVYRKCF